MSIVGYIEEQIAKETLSLALASSGEDQLIRARLDAYNNVLKQLQAKPGINPITFTGHDQATGEKVMLTVSRLHLRVPVKGGSIRPGQQRINPLDSNAFNQRRIDIVAWQGDPSKMSEDSFLAKCVIDEEHFVNGLLHLFPNGELNG